MPANSGDGVLEIAPHTANQGEEEMPSDETQASANAHEQNMAQVAQMGLKLAEIGHVAQQNFTATTQFAHLDYLEGKRIISVEEAMGIREVASKNVPAGPSSDP